MLMSRLMPRLANPLRGLERWDEGWCVKGSLVYTLLYWRLISYTPPSFVPPFEPFVTLNATVGGGLVLTEARES